MRAERIELNTTMGQVRDMIGRQVSVREHVVDPALCRLRALMVSADPLLCAPSYFGFRYPKEDADDSRPALHMDWEWQVSRGMHASVSFIFPVGPDGLLTLDLRETGAIFSMYINPLAETDAEAKLVLDEVYLIGAEMTVREMVSSVGIVRSQQQERLLGWINP